MKKNFKNYSLKKLKNFFSIITYLEFFSQNRIQKIKGFLKASTEKGSQQVNNTCE